jgi:exodeoxyribonuclease VII large subunit
MSAPKKTFTLLQLTQSIRKALDVSFGGRYWIVAEMNKLNLYPQSGHAYPELVEKQNGVIVAEIRGILWKNNFDRINQSFIHVLNEPLKDGIKVLMNVSVGFDSKYGVSLVIHEIDPGYTLGDLEQEKQNSIQALKKQGVFDLNRKKSLPLLPKRLAIISVANSNGYQDFTHIIDGNSWKYKFFHMLFPSLLQGDRAVADLTKQLNRIRKVAHHFDAVVIVRGGGGDVGLTCYNDFNLCRIIAEFPLPVLTGIGHQVNESVADMVSFKNLITPTDLGHFFIQQFHDYSLPVQQAEASLADKSLRLLSETRSKLHSNVLLFRSVVETTLVKNTSKVDTFRENLRTKTIQRITNEKENIQKISKALANDARTLLTADRVSVSKLQEGIKNRINVRFTKELMMVNGLENSVRLLDPRNVLKRGFSITLVNGKAVTDESEVNSGAEITTLLYNGTIKSRKE